MKDLEKQIDQYMRERNWHHPQPVDLAKSVMIEGAELLELFQWDNLSLTETKKDKEKIEKIKDELADVLIYAIEMSVAFGFDTKKIILKKLAQAKKKYPAKLMRELKKSGAGDMYWKIKEEYRKKK